MAASPEAVKDLSQNELENYLNTLTSLKDFVVPEDFPLCYQAASSILTESGIKKLAYIRYMLMAAQSKVASENNKFIEGFITIIDQLVEDPMAGGESLKVYLGMDAGFLRLDNFEEFIIVKAIMKQLQHIAHDDFTKTTSMGAWLVTKGKGITQVFSATVSSIMAMVTLISTLGRFSTNASVSQLNVDIAQELQAFLTPTSPCHALTTDEKCQKLTSYVTRLKQLPALSISQDNFSVIFNLNKIIRSEKLAQALPNLSISTAYHNTILNLTILAELMGKEDSKDNALLYKTTLHTELSSLISSDHLSKRINIQEELKKIHSEFKDEVDVYKKASDGFFGPGDGVKAKIAVLENIEKKLKHFAYDKVAHDNAELSDNARLTGIIITLVNAYAEHFSANQKYKQYPGETGQIISRLTDQCVGLLNKIKVADLSKVVTAIEAIGRVIDSDKGYARESYEP